jgi:hypothetical protein
VQTRGWQTGWPQTSLVAIEAERHAEETQSQPSISRSQYVKRSCRRCGRGVQSKFELHSRRIRIDPSYNYGCFCNLRVQLSPALWDGGSASLNLCGVLLSGRDRFLRVCGYYGHKKNLYNIEICFMFASSFGLAYIFSFLWLHWRGN